MSSAVPAELKSAIQNSSQTYGVPEDILTGVWRIESGSTFPNPAVNSSGYGGLFGTTEWNYSTQAQSNYAASILSNWYSKTGSWDTALHYYSSGTPTGGYGLSKVNAVNGSPANVSSGGSSSQSSDPGFLGIPGAINNFSSTVANIPNTIMSDLKPIGIGVGIGLLAILLIVIGVFAIIAPAAKNNMPAVVPIPV